MNSFGTFTLGTVLGAAALFGLAYFTDPDSKAFKERFFKKQEESEVDSMSSGSLSENKTNGAEENTDVDKKENPSADSLKNA